MTRKFKFFSFFFILLLLLFVLGVVSVEKKDSGPFIKSIKSILPYKFKVMLKQTVFIIPALHRRIQLQEATVNDLKIKIIALNKKVEHLFLFFQLL